MSDSSVRSRWFKKSQASLKLEVLDPSGTTLYEGIKQRIIAGKITYEQGRAEIFTYHAERAKNIKV